MLLGYSLLSNFRNADILLKSSEHAQSSILVGGRQHLTGRLTEVGLVLFHHVAIP